VIREDEWTNAVNQFFFVVAAPIVFPSTICHIPPQGIMKFGSSVLFSVLVAAGTYNCDAFTIPQPQIVTPRVISKSSILVPSSIGLILPSSEPSQGRTAPFLKMVAGGAERAYGDEYYEGTCLIDELKI
jgi:hypothetical protein